MSNPHRFIFRTDPRNQRIISEPTRVTSGSASYGPRSASYRPRSASYGPEPTSYAVQKSLVRKSPLFEFPNLPGGEQMHGLWDLWQRHKGSKTVKIGYA